MKEYHLVLSESGAVPTDRRTAKRRIMQVGSSVSNRYYTSYQTNKSVKYCAGFSQTEDGKLTPNETTENLGFAELVNYQEFHKAWMSQNGGNKVDYHFGTAYRVPKTEDDTDMSREVVSIAETEDEGEFLGLTMVPEEGQSVTYGMRAMLSVQSTPDNPIVQVVSNLGGKKVIYNVEVNKVNPGNATQLEMFALLSYTDKMGITDGGIFGSHQQLEVYGGNASSIGYCGSLSSSDVFLNKRFDWTSIMEKMVQVYKDAGIENQAEDCKALFDFFSTYKEKSEVKENTAIDFSRFAPNVPEEVKKAFSEAAEETGYYEYSGKGKINYISQILVKQVENRQNGVENYTDVFGGSVASALQAAREMMYDLENPLKPDSQRSEDIIKYREQEKEFYKAFIEKLEMLEDKSVSKSEKHHRQPGEVPEEFAGMSFLDLINSGKGNAIPTVDKIVNAKNPEDGKIYLTFFTEDKISCYEPGGEKTWELDISNEEQGGKIKKFFENYMPDRAHVQEYYSDADLGIVSSKEFWLELFEDGFIGDTPGTTQEPEVGSLEEITDYYEFIRQKIEEIFVKIQNGDTEASYQIGSQSFTEKEWEEFLDKFDSVEEAIQELMKEEQARKEAEEVKKEDEFIDDVSTLLTTESTSCVYETADPDDDDIRYITWYTEEGIFCRKAGQTEGYEWSITFENKEQYDKVMEFIGQFPSDWNMRFAAHENFWNDFLNDEIDMEGFREFINGTNKGVPDYSITVGNSMYIDKDKMQWAKYTNPLGARFYTAEEMHQMQMEIIEANQAKLTKLSDSYGEVYKQNHPDYNGERIFCEYPGGTLYTADEIGRLRWQQFLAEMNMTEEEMQQKREEWRKQMGYPGY